MRGIFKLVPWFIGLVFILIVTSYVAMGFVALKAAEDPNGTAYKIGEIVKSFKDGAK